MSFRKNTFAKKASAIMLTLCLIATTLAPCLSPVYAAEGDGSVTSTSVATVDEGAPVSTSDSTSQSSSTPSSSDSTSESNSTSQDSNSNVSDTGDSSSSSTGDSSSSSASSSDSQTPDSGSSSVPTDDSSLPTDDSSSNSGTDTDTDESVPTDSETTDTNESDSDSEETEEPTDEFVALTVLDPETGDTIEAEIGSQVSLEFGLSRDDLQVSYQWEKYIEPEAKSVEESGVTPIYDYAEGAPTWYNYSLEDKLEASLLAENPDATWSGIETYYAVVDALNEIGADSSNVSIAWQTPNYALDGYEITAANVNGVVEVYADKDGERRVATLNEEGKWAFGEAQAVVAEEEGVWLDIEGATEPTYSFTVSEVDYRTTYRLKVTILDETYLSECINMLTEQGIELTDEQIAEEQNIYSIAMHVHSDAYDAAQMASEPVSTFSGMTMMRAMLGAVSVPTLSADHQWIENLNSTYEYITKDTYDRVAQWVKEGRLTEEQASYFWTKLGTGFTDYYYAYVLDENGFPSGGTRLYNGFNLTNGHMLEVASEWYGKTVYFRVAGTSGTGTAIDIPAYTELTDGSDGYTEAASGSKYKKAVAFLNAYVKDATSMYKTYLDYTTSDGWLLELDSEGNFTTNRKDIHITTYIVDAESFNADPQRYMVDAEGNYRMDSVGWGVCVGAEPDLSGKAYHVLKDYISNGYGFLSGHDTMYAYPGAYYDAYGYDLDESTIDPNDGTTWYYDINSWAPGTSATNPAGEHSRERGGHFYMNALMGSNSGNVYSKTTVPSDAPSLILSTGGSNGKYGKNIQFGNNLLRITQTGYTAEQAAENPKYRTPTNYPYSFELNSVIDASYTHSNQQAAFGTIWVNYAGGNYYHDIYGYYADPMTWTVGGKTGTNNFYLTGNGNFLMNQIGHLPRNSATTYETILFANSVMYVSQRKQCEICAANQDGQQTSHFVRRVNSANADEVLTALQNGGSYWYPLDGCYMLTDDITLPEDWVPIEHFNGHWNSDVYTVTLNSKGTPLLANDSADGESGWNLGTDQSKGVENVFDKDMNRVTGVARVLGDLNDLFGTDMNYAGYTVKILGSDNPKYMSADEEYSCTVNTDSKYVISNLPCVYDKTDMTGVLTARVYDPSGKEVIEYGSIRVNVDKNFWSNDMTIPLYLGSFSSEPVANDATYEAGQAFFDAYATSADDFDLIRWEYKKPGEETWNTVPESWDVTVSTQKFAPGEDEDSGDLYRISSRLAINDADPNMDNYEFRAVFGNDKNGEWNTYEYWWQGVKASCTEVAGWNHKVLYDNENSGRLNVELWPVYAEQDANKTVNEGDDVSFTVTALALADGTKISVEWEYAPKSTTSINGQDIYDWRVVGSDSEFGGLEKITQKDVEVDVSNSDAINYALHTLASDNNLDTFWSKAGFQQIESTLSLSKLDVTQTDYRFRAHFTAESQYGTKYDWYSDIANEWNGSWNTDDGSFGNYSRKSQPGYSNILTVIPPELRLVTSTSDSFAEGGANQDLMTPDEYGQTLLLKTLSSTVCDGTAAYRATLYYRPEDGEPTPTWQYMTYSDRTARVWNQDVANSLGYSGIKVWVENSEPMEATYNGETGWMAIVSTMYISNAPITMYNPESWVKYYFRCVGTSVIETVKGTKELAASDKWGGLSMDYAIAIWHNGVIGYDGVNKINSTTVNTSSGIEEATKGRTYSDWYYPNLAIKVPTGHHINTAIVSFDDEVGFNSNDRLLVDSNGLASLGINVQQSGTDYVILVSKTKNTVSIESWQQALRQYVGFRTYDVADYSYENVINNTTGGGGIKWIVDEARYAGTTYDPDTGKLYKVIDFGKATDWATANTKAQAYDSELGMTGHLAIIENATQNSLVHSLVGNRNAWLDGKYSGGRWTWDWTNASISYMPWSSSAQKTNANLYMTTDGGWSSAPIITSTTGDKTWTSGWTAYAQGNIQWYQGSGLPRQVTTAPIYIDTGVAPNPHTITVHLDALSQKAGGAPADGDAGYGIEGYINGRWQMLNNGSFGTFSDGVVAKIFNGQTYAVETFSVPAGCTAIRASVYNFANAVTYFGKIRIYIDATARVSTTTTTNPVTAAVVEYEPQGLSFAVTDHSASDTAVVGTNTSNPPIPGDKIVSAVIKGNTKVYDGENIVPESFVVSGSEGASRDLFQITYTTDGQYADYVSRTVNGEDYTETGAVNAARYHARVELTQEAIDAGWKLDTGYSQLECDLVIFQRPVNVYSYNNDKVYDGTSSGVITNITASPRTDDTGIIGGDTVRFNTTTVFGTYVDEEGRLTVHNSKTNNNGNEWTMHRSDSLSSLYIVHDDTSDPHRNYVLGTETYSGDINQRGLYVHSLYLEDENNPRNVKTYDRTDAATVSDIVIDNAAPGETVTLTKETLSGKYSTSQAGETLNPDGSLQDNRLTKLDENVITLTEKPEIANNDFGDYFIEKEAYSGAICRALLEVMIEDKNEMYGTDNIGDPYYDDEYRFNKHSESWVNMDGLIDGDVLELDDSFIDLDAYDKDGNPIDFVKTTPVGDYTVELDGLTSDNLPVLNNYFVVIHGGSVKIYPREVRVTAADTDWYVEDIGTPKTHAIFEMIADDEQSYLTAYSDEDTAYDAMPLVEGDTVYSSILVKDGASTNPLTTGSMSGLKEFGSGDTRHTVFNNGSNISYNTTWYNTAPALYQDLNNDISVYPCEWCESYHGFSLGTEHWKITGYRLSVNQNASEGPTLDVAYVTNPLGEQVQNYKLTYVDGLLRVHPELRFQLSATVPLYVCMYGYSGDGEVVEPETYGITNYSNGAIKITDIDVSLDGWSIVDKDPADLLRGEMSMKLMDTQVVGGHNKPANWNRWIIEADKSEDDSGVEMLIPMTCYIAGGNVNDVGEEYIAHVTYTIAEHGLTVPEVDGVEIPDVIDGQPTTVVDAD